MRLLSRGRQFTARGPVPPWWRRPAVIGVLAVCLVGAGLAVSGDVGAALSGREVGRWSREVRAVALPEPLVEWGGACGVFGLRCAGTQAPPGEAAEAMAATLRGLGLELPPVRCGEAAEVDAGTTLATMPRHEGHCTTTATLGGARLTVAAWDHVTAVRGGEGLDLGRTALVVEWDDEGLARLLAAEPRLPEKRFADVRLTPEEIASLPGELAQVGCVASDADGCTRYETTLRGPGHGRELMEHRARELLAADFLVTSFECPEHAKYCELLAEAGRGDGLMSHVTVSLSARPEPGVVQASVHVG